MSKWQPIETVPRDGTIILITNGRSVMAAYWSLGVRVYGGAGFGINAEYAWAFLDETNGLNGFKAEGKHSPTHWMPLPEPPSNEGAA